MLSPSDFLIRHLIDEGMLTPEGAERATAHAREQGVSVEDALAETKVLAARDVAIAKASLAECAFVDPTRYEIPNRNAELLPRSAAESLEAFPLFVIDSVITVGMADPLDLRSIDQLRQLLRAEIEPVLCERAALRSIIRRAYSMVGAPDAGNRNTADDDDDLVTGQEPIVAAVNQILAGGIEAAASDIHISPTESELQLRYRIDGRLRLQDGPPLSAHAGIAQRLKVMAGLDLTQTRRPQDGKFRFTHRGEQYEVRLSTLPTVSGENVVMRLLRPNAEILGFEQLGVPSRMIDLVGELIDHPHGMLLVTGPTGSGKTSTLYTAINLLNQPERNIMTIEDPVEIRMHGVRQIQTHAEIGLTFAGALRSILRQDPDVVLVGEIRDEETAQISTQASLTGHLVLSTLHTNDSAGAIARLQDLGVPPFVITSSVLGVIAQRLVRRVCPDCAGPANVSEIVLRRFGLEPHAAEGMREGAGCARCSNTGYRGRTGIYELLSLTPEVCRLIESSATTKTIAARAFAGGPEPIARDVSRCIGPMWRDGLDKARLGVTTLDEVARAVMTTGVADADEPDQSAETRGENDNAPDAMRTAA
jgi:type IV pilus assembly protein PilB